MENVSVFFPPTLTETGRKVPITQYELEIEVSGEVAAAGERIKKQKKQRLLWPECLDLLPLERKLEIIQEALVEAARADTEKTAVIKEG